jgi:hypothetical protein
MPEQMKGTVTIDYSVVGGKVTPGSPVVIDLDDHGRPASAAVGVPPDQFSILIKDFRKIHGAMKESVLNGTAEDGTPLQIVVGTASGLGASSHGPLELTLIPRTITVGPAGGRAAAAGESWAFRLSNVTMAVGDTATQYEGGSSSLNRINFHLAGRVWSLTDESAAPQPSQVGPQGSGCVLSVPAVAEENVSLVLPHLQEVATLLSFAMGTHVNWTESRLVGPGGVVWRERRNVHVPRLKQGMGRINQDDPQIGGVIRSFLEECHPCLVADWDSLRQAIGVYAEAQVADEALVKAAFLNMLLDRLQKEVNRAGFPPQINPGLDAKLDKRGAFIGELHALLGHLSPNWTQDLTNQIVGEIKRRNAGPGFGKAVRIAFESLGLTGFDKLNLSARHKILHDAELPLTPEEVLPFLTELDLLVFLMIARRLGYTGQFWHAHLQDTRRVSDLLSPRAG